MNQANMAQHFNVEKIEWFSSIWLQLLIHAGAMIALVLIVGVVMEVNPRPMEDR